jgi:pyridoxine/pyridoxamine 5'-phosphate oxidase
MHNFTKKYYAQNLQYFFLWFNEKLAEETNYFVALYWSNQHNDGKVATAIALIKKLERCYKKKDEI